MGLNNNKTHNNMDKLHDKGIKKFNKYLGYVFSIIFTLMLLFSALMKLMENEFLVDSMKAIHLLPSMKLIALIEIICLVLYWIPKTVKVGFYLLCFFMGSVIAAELIALEGVGIPVPGVPLAILLVLGTFLRKPSILFDYK